MAKREIEEINASSMADIAFLLLVFFLVTSAMLKEKVQEERLPQKIDIVDPIKVRPYNVLEITANKDNLILIENDFYVNQGSEVEEISDYVDKFFKHPGSESEVLWPAVTIITEQAALAAVEDFTAKVVQYPDIDLYADSLNLWEKKLKTCQSLGGSYNEISDKAVIAITLDNTTTYDTYIMVLDGILTGLYNLRNELCEQKFKRPFDSLDEDIPEDKEILDAIQIVYPKRIFKTKGIAAAN